jgi:hypothetical protein
MKKILLIVAVVLCVAVAGAAIAVTYNDATTINGTLTADSYLELSLDNCSTTAINLVEGEPTKYTIQCDLTKSENGLGDGTCTLTITLANGVSTDLDDVTIAIYTDPNCTIAVEGATRKGEGAVTVTGITTSKTYYAKLTLDNGLDESETANVGGTMTLSFAKA